MTEFSVTGWHGETDLELARQVGRFVRHHRLRQDRTQGEVADAAGVSRSTVALVEKGEGTNLLSVIRVLRALDLLYVMDVFRVEEEISPLEYAKAQRQRQRARRRRDGEGETSEW